MNITTRKHGGVTEGEVESLNGCRSGDFLEEAPPPTPAPAAANRMK